TTAVASVSALVHCVPGISASTVKKQVTKATSARSREWLKGKCLRWMVVMRKRIT
ncbi:hypothetical protein A2U01_0073281, partial [Trifolium medium]|nr:hypothetical protein [Trifolium medium]